MEDFDVFTNEINFTKPLYTNILKEFLRETPETPNGSNYQSGRKLQAEECLADNEDLACAFHLSESVSATVRIMAIYRNEQLKLSSDKLYGVKSYIRPIRDLIANSKPEQGESLPFKTDDDVITDLLDKFEIKDEEPFHRTYLKFSAANNVDNFQKILKEIPKEWTVVQLTAPYNPNEMIKPLSEFRSEIDSIYLSVFTNDYLDDNGPFTVQIPANTVKEGERPLFVELYSLLEDNFKTIENAQLLNNKRLVRNYWARREDIDLRMKSVINIMDREWLGGWSCLMTGKLLDSTLRDKVRKLVDDTIDDWGFIKLTKKQKILLYNLMECCGTLSSSQIKSCIRKILTEHGNPDNFREILDTTDCEKCTTEFNFINELCLKCLAKCFEKIHNFSLVDGVKAFSQTAIQIREYDEWATLRKAKRHPLILIVDEMLDTFPWECLPLLSTHPVTRIENIHFLYNLYKVHEENIKDGHFTIKAEKGRYLINPECNLERMERRMSSFVRYWCGTWQGHVGEQPPPDTFLSYLQEGDLFLYCGHGDGSQFASGGARGAGVEGCVARAVAVLSGCGSTRLNHQPGRGPPQAAHHSYHIANCPQVVGMLWEVTDLEVDKVVSSLLALCVPSNAPHPWEAVGKSKWGQGILEMPSDPPSRQPSRERDLLTAVSRARRSSTFVMIASSVVARGLPVRILDN